MKKMKVTLVGAGSLSFALGALQDMVLSDRLKNQVDLEIALMDIVEENLNRTYKYATEMFSAFSHPAKITQTTKLEEALTNANFVIVAIEVNRYFYWSQDFHIPRRYGSKQIYGENGGPGSMFHTLRNLGPMLEIARTMEKVCPDAWMINFTNPEAKLVEAISKLTSIKIVGLCHGLDMGIDQISQFLEMDREDIGVEGGGLNHFGFFTKIWNKKTGEDLYPLFDEKEKKADRLAQFDHIGLSRTMYRTYGYYPYPGTNHIGEYVSYAGDFYAGLSLQYRYDPIREELWEKDSRVPDFIYCASGHTLDKGLFSDDMTEEEWIEETFKFDKDKVHKSNEYAIPIIEAIFFDEEIQLNSVNMQNNGAIKGLPDDMVVETQAIVNGQGIKFVPMSVELPTAIIGTIHIQGTIHKLLLEAFVEQSKTKLLQAILLDPQAPSYYQACAMIDEMCELQKDILPKLEWK
ncbi:alpha-galactosidase [Lederbergia wuyishanensis]|uniref:Alpha-galactosidase n=1 Tax=Lederbergia wuyishanensis TaxID=1347903 RepID=A0ABU0D9M2_9BACI|nr:alpha-galactosidase [Lederbergia wuyishanensis]MCJ8007450.1 alpha-galactosidase [Lederbergia wuyishanensis]MDQ0345111.1 alpha-galactosidase [Lederbergia wuyishanensis]